MSKPLVVEQHGFLSGFFKAREHLFFGQDERMWLSQAQTIEQLAGYMSSGRYAKALSFMADPKDFENALWEIYSSEINIAQQHIEEPYLTEYLLHFHSIIFSQKDIAFNYKAEREFEERLNVWVKLSLQGTDFTRQLSAYAVDHFNFTEHIRARLHEHADAPFYTHGNISTASLIVLFDSQFQKIPQDILFSLWFSFVETEKPIKNLDFDLILRLEYYWLDIMRKIIEDPLKEPFGINYLLAYFLFFMLEIETLKRQFLRVKFDLPSYWMKERYGS